MTLLINLFVLKITAVFCRIIYVGYYLINLIRNSKNASYETIIWILHNIITHVYPILVIYRNMYVFRLSVHNLRSECSVFVLTKQLKKN